MSGSTIRAKKQGDGKKYKKEQSREISKFPKPCPFVYNLTKINYYANYSQPGFWVRFEFNVNSLIGSGRK